MDDDRAPIHGLLLSHCVSPASRRIGGHAVRLSRGIDPGVPGRHGPVSGGHVPWHPAPASQGSPGEQRSIDRRHRTSSGVRERARVLPGVPSIRRHDAYAVSVFLAATFGEGVGLVALLCGLLSASPRLRVKRVSVGRGSFAVLRCSQPTTRPRSGACPERSRRGGSG
jgi:hypothetical protein